MTIDADTTTSPPGNSSVPVLFQYCLKAYELMESTAKHVRADGGEVNMLVWEGFYTKLIYDPPMSLSTPYYTLVRKHLLDMGCIRQLQRGGGTTMSRWELLRKPTVEMFTSIHNTTAIPKPSKAPESDQRILDLQKRVNKIEENQKIILDHVVKKDRD